MAHKLNRDREHRKPERERRTSENSGIDKQLGSVLALSKMYVWRVHTHSHRLTKRSGRIWCPSYLATRFISLPSLCVPFLHVF